MENDLSAWPGHPQGDLAEAPGSWLLAWAWPSLGHLKCEPAAGNLSFLLSVTLLFWSIDQIFLFSVLKSELEPGTGNGKGLSSGICNYCPKPLPRDADVSSSPSLLNFKITREAKA